MTKKIIGIIPARYKSSRFPGKPLTKLLGKPMVLWVAELSGKALGNENVFVATEDERIKKVVEDEGFNVVMTSDTHLTGTDRLSEVAQKVHADIYINIQGDEPTINHEIIQAVANMKVNNDSYVINAMAKLNTDEDPGNINIPKVITTEDNEMVYMSRMTIPGFKNYENRPETYYKQVCIYAFNREQLLGFGDFGRKSRLESSEDIEILRYLDLGIGVKMLEVEGNSYAVDVEEDIAIVERRLKEIHKL
ncbi:3-deoxy-manno-octulosonate cytidylyltransferase [Polaribacter porphyrae]|uniref:3-deoxy-manno-octulosonate cytidylyltransferase n=1 Tax=Polaribacter porphyrae TaxID=1137780 RepID=A0A2S7WJK2_9FLAO|nr:3-deoxy-manno-octulosonate cytidylyltransferase [Polaribacter porphyrae]PQJ77763.1 3-deoxy-manno-octulosonate cytidylyltransferase [Polaribacter porphyrae]